MDSINLLPFLYPIISKFFFIFHLKFKIFIYLHLIDYESIRLKKPFAYFDINTLFSIFCLLILID